MKLIWMVLWETNLGSHDSRYFRIWIPESVAQGDLIFSNLDPFNQLSQQQFDVRRFPFIEIVFG